MRSAAGSLFSDTLTLSKSAFGSAFARLGRLVPGSSPKRVSSVDTKACGHGALAAAQSARLVEGDGVVAPEDAYLILGGKPPDLLTAEALAEAEQAFANRESAEYDAVPGKGQQASSLAEDVHIEMGNSSAERSNDVPPDQSPPSYAAAGAAANDAESGRKLSGDLVTAVMLDKRLASLTTDSISVSRQLLQAAGGSKTATSTHSILTDASEEVTKLGMAAIAVNEAEASLGEVTGEEEQDELPHGQGLPAGMTDGALGAAVEEAQQEAALAPALEGMLWTLAQMSF